METGIPVKNETENLNNKEFISRPRISGGEALLGQGAFYKPIFTLLIWSNFLVLASRYNYLNNTKFLIFSFPVSHFIGFCFARLMGDSIYREATKLSVDTLGSAKVYEKKYDGSN
jgi:hypothetical protein